MDKPVFGVPQPETVLIFQVNPGIGMENRFETKSWDSSMRLECDNLKFTYPGGDQPVIRDLSFSMTDSGFNAVFGPSGVGKTSLARLIAGLDHTSRGRVIREDMDRALYSYNLERLPGWSGIGHHLDRVTPEDRQDLKERLCNLFEMSDILASRFSNLSMGQQNRINLIRYLLQDFDLLIMDESLANVDEKLRETIILGIKEIFPDKMFLYISHNLMEVSKFCREILVLGRPGEGGSTMIAGRNYGRGYHLNKGDLDRTMLEIMNAF